MHAARSAWLGSPVKARLAAQRLRGGRQRGSQARALRRARRGVGGRGRGGRVALAQLARMVRLRAARGGIRVCQAALRALGRVTGDPGWSMTCSARAYGDRFELTPHCVHTEAGSYTPGMDAVGLRKRPLCNPRSETMTCRAGRTRLQVGAVALQLRRARSQLDGAPGLLHCRRSLCRRCHLCDPRLFAHSDRTEAWRALARSGKAGTEHVTGWRPGALWHARQGRHRACASLPHNITTS